MSVVKDPIRHRIRCRHSAVEEPVSEPAPAVVEEPSNEDPLPLFQHPVPNL